MEEGWGETRADSLATQRVEAIVQRLPTRTRGLVERVLARWLGRTLIRTTDAFIRLEVFDRSMTIAAQFFTSVLPILILTARTSWQDNGAIVVVSALDDAIPLVDRLAPEHLELAVENPQPLFDKVRHAGSVFLGRHTPEAVGDYVAGPNHVLPTGRRARFSSGLSVLDFMKRTSFLACDAQSLARIGPAAVALAGAEGLPAHALSVSVRLNS